ncbi:glutamyl-tRNA(Gln) amidotransferase subunit E [Nanobdella aerobiophila]|uniref:Glutamyl-tRNA(Gln) amidotransferase subunit E n=1 Tax=Nanobdella aerobiophila TaxID=2586965 RepID=A0A915SKW2_9ARCH|nr:Glu-tRNA(Gln) amidotransferase subunit GatE [Nanobdella aerobiophila]BBL45908.1 glutamyl-tRNA(Gln) amidotransferase subunit E [Nanobdella aerobiophila]
MKIGLEIHQQINTKNKLFCNCNTDLKEDYKYRIERKLRATLSETGKKDIAAEYETIKDKKYIYEYDKDYACLVELDEEPPKYINLDALKFGILISTYFNMYIPRVLQIMRKIVVDGSNTSGFQRTLLLSLDGKLNYKNIGIGTLCIEEDAARKIEEKDDYIIYRLDRLGIPLIEISTDPDIKDPKEAKEVAEYIGLILRLSGKVKRGLGTIRQDLNVSIEGGNKVEIKGVQNLKIIDKIVDLEAKRQEKILELINIAKERGIEGYVLEE